MCHNVKKAAIALGFNNHPSFKEAEEKMLREHDWTYRRIVYRSAGGVQYSRRPLLKVGASKSSALAAGAIQDDGTPAALAIQDRDAADHPQDEGVANNVVAIVNDSSSLLALAGTVNVIDELKKDCALKLFAFLIETLSSHSTIFCMPVAPAAIQSLRQALSSSSLIEAPLQQQWWDEAGFAPIVCFNGFTFDDEMASASMNDTERIWFKLVFRRPSKAKRAQAGHLSTPDLGVSLHRPLMRNTVSQRNVVNSDPIRFAHQACVSEYGNVPLIFSPQHMDLTSLIRIQSWRVEPTLWYRMNMQADHCLPVEPENCYTHINDTVRGLITSETFIVSPKNASHDDVQILLQHYQEHGLVKSEAGTWSLTSEGRRRIIVGNVLHGSVNVFRPRDVQYEEMLVFELMAVLEGEGWSCAVSCPQLKKPVRKAPFDRGKSPLTWYVDQAGPVIISSWRVCSSFCRDTGVCRLG